MYEDWHFAESIAVTGSHCQIIQKTICDPLLTGFIIACCKSGILRCFIDQFPVIIRDPQTIRHHFSYRSSAASQFSSYRNNLLHVFLPLSSSSHLQSEYRIVYGKSLCSLCRTDFHIHTSAHKTHFLFHLSAVSLYFFSLDLYTEHTYWHNVPLILDHPFSEPLIEYDHLTSIFISFSNCILNYMIIIESREKLKIFSVFC